MRVMNGHKSGNLTVFTMQLTMVLKKVCMNSPICKSLQNRLDKNRQKLISICSFSPALCTYFILLIVFFYLLNIHNKWKLSTKPPFGMEWLLQSPDSSHTFSFLRNYISLYYKIVNVRVNKVIIIIIVSIYTLSDLGVLSNLIGSLSLAN